ncbi:L-rhamnose mutarotase, partial [Actinoplanes derwentensis]
MERHGQVVDVRAEKRDEYVRLHAAVWPAVEETLTRCNVRNYSIFLVEKTLFAYYEYVGDDHDADMARIAADPVTREWWKLTDPCQEPWGGETPAGEGPW